MNISILKEKKVAELKEIGKAFGVEGYDKMKKSELIEALTSMEKQDNSEAEEVIEMPMDEVTEEKE